MDIAAYLQAFINNNVELNAVGHIQLPHLSIDPEQVLTVMINEVAPPDPKDDFYSNDKTSAYAESAKSLFEAAGVNGQTPRQLLNSGIYLTNAVKTAKSGYTIENNTIHLHSLLLEHELACFPQLKAIMLMGDVAKKSFNFISKRHQGKNVIPSGSTYKLRKETFFLGDIRLFPSYIMTGANLLIEKSKTTMIVEDIQQMLEMLSNQK